MPPNDYEDILPSLQATLKEQGDPWRPEVTSLSQLSLDEKRRFLGYVPGPTELSLQDREQRAKASLATYSERRAEAFSFPASYDLRNVGGQNFITSVKNQGSCGSCVSFGSIAAVEGTLRVAKSDPNLQVDYSEAHLFYCHARGQGRRCGGANGGWWVEPALDCFKNPGVVDDACYPYTPGDQNCTGLCSDWQGRVSTITGWHAITTQEAMKVWLSTRGPLVACFTVYDDFFNYHSGIYHHESGALAGGHCVCCVGYNDAEQYWICKNSWGTGFGESGFFRIRYGEVGIDAVMWAIEGVNHKTKEDDDVVTGQWHKGVKVRGLWATDGDRNAWAYLDGIGWRRVAYDNDNIFFNMLTHLAAAKAAARPVDVYVEQNVIKQVYVL
jgi:C1A family cysteine protease